MLRYYMDVNVPAAITSGLRRCGIDVLTSQEDGTREWEDDSLLTRAREVGRVLFSQDTDLLRIAHAWQSQEQPFLGLVFAPQLGTSIGQCITDLELLGKCTDPTEVANQVIFLPLP